MECTVCFNSSQVNTCVFGLDVALLNIKNHYEYFQTALQEKEKQNVDLLKRNEHLNKAIAKLNEQLKYYQTRQQNNTEECTSSKRSRVDIIGTDLNDTDEIIEVIDENNVYESESILDTALNGTVLNATSPDVITETEMHSPKLNVRRRGMIDFKSKLAHAKKRASSNDENKQPTPSKSMTKNETSVSQDFIRKVVDSHEKEQTTTKVKVTQSEAIDFSAKKRLKQTRLKFLKPDIKPTRDISTEQNSDHDDEFDFERTATFCLDNSSAEKNNTFNESMPSSANSEPSVLALTIPKPPVIYVNDSTQEDQFEQESDDDFVINKPILKNDQFKSNAKIIVRPIEKRAASSKKLFHDTSTCSFRHPEISNLVCKKEPLTPTLVQVQPAQSIAPSTFHGNPIFMQTESSEEMEEDFPHPIKVKKELEPKPAACKKCKSYLNCICDDLQEQEIMPFETPENFWNPHLDSFSESDPRNEILIDTRFVGIKRADKGGGQKN